MTLIKKTTTAELCVVFISRFASMENKIIIEATNKKALALLDKLQEKKQSIKKQMQNSPIVSKLRLNMKPR
jgi:hypothetical protein